MFSLRKAGSALPRPLAGAGTGASLVRLYPTQRACGKRGTLVIQKGMRLQNYKTDATTPFAGCNTHPGCYTNFEGLQLG